MQQHSCIFWTEGLTRVYRIILFSLLIFYFFFFIFHKKIISFQLLGGAAPSLNHSTQTTIEPSTRIQERCKNYYYCRCGLWIHFFFPVFALFLNHWYRVCCLFDWFMRAHCAQFNVLCICFVLYFYSFRSPYFIMRNHLLR